MKATIGISKQELEEILSQYFGVSDFQITVLESEELPSSCNPFRNAAKMKGIVITSDGE